MNIRVKFGLISLLVILIQSTIKIIGVLITGSLSFLSETVDTVIDIFFAIITIYSLYQSQKPPDFEHMYGHSKIDAIGALVQGIILINVYFYIIVTAIQTILSGDFGVQNADFGFILLIISFVINLIYSRVLIWQGKSKKSLTLRVQGLNLFQDSLRAILVLINFGLALFLDIRWLDPYFSLILSIFIIVQAVTLSKDGIKELADTNPIDSIVLEDLKRKIFNLEHVNGVEEIKARKSGGKLFLEVHLAVEDHISVVHANEVTTSIRTMSKNYFPSYDVETIIEMNPLGGEKSIGENIINLIFSLISEYKDIIDIQDVNVFRIKRDYFLSLTIIVDQKLTLEKAHDLTTNLEEELKAQAPSISRIISHIEGEKRKKSYSPESLKCEDIGNERLNEIKQQVEEILRKKSYVKGFHGLEFWSAYDFCIIELHIFFEGSLNISKVHELISELENEIRKGLNISDLQELILHSEPVAGRTDGIIF